MNLQSLEPKSSALARLGYIPLAVRVGLEPTTQGLTVLCANQLRYLTILATADRLELPLMIPKTIVLPLDDAVIGGTG